MLLSEPRKQNLAKMLVLPFHVMGCPDHEKKVFFCPLPLPGKGFCRRKGNLVDLTEKDYAASPGRLPWDRNPLLPLLRPSGKREMKRIGQGKEPFKEASIPRKNLCHAQSDFTAQDTGDIGPDLD